jgi:hypothetical protein
MKCTSVFETKFSFRGRCLRDDDDFAGSGVPVHGAEPCRRSPVRNRPYRFHPKPRPGGAGHCDGIDRTIYNNTTSHASIVCCQCGTPKHHGVGKGGARAWPNNHTTLARSLEGRGVVAYNNCLLTDTHASRQGPDNNGIRAVNGARVSRVGAVPDGNASNAAVLARARPHRNGIITAFAENAPAGPANGNGVCAACRRIVVGGRLEPNGNGVGALGHPPRVVPDGNGVNRAGAAGAHADGNAAGGAHWAARGAAAQMHVCAADRPRHATGVPVQVVGNELAGDTHGARGAGRAGGARGTNRTSGTSGTNRTSGTSGTNRTSGTSGSNRTSGTGSTNRTSGTGGTNRTSGTGGTNRTSGTGFACCTGGSNSARGTGFSRCARDTSGSHRASGSSSSCGSCFTRCTSGSHCASGSSGTNRTSGTGFACRASGSSGSSGAHRSSGTGFTSRPGGS